MTNLLGWWLLATLTHSASRKSWLLWTLHLRRTGADATDLSTSSPLVLRSRRRSFISPLAHRFCWIEVMSLAVFSSKTQFLLLSSPLLFSFFLFSTAILSYLWFLLFWLIDSLTPFGFSVTQSCWWFEYVKKRIVEAVHITKKSLFSRGLF